MYHSTVVVHAPVQQQQAKNILSYRNRLNMALAFLNSNSQLSAKKYAKMTGMSTDMAEAELDAFSFDKNIPIGYVVNGKKKVYVLTA